MRKLFTSSLAYWLIFPILFVVFGVKAQNNLYVNFKDAVSAPRNLVVCGDVDTVIVTVRTEGLSPATRQNIRATMNLFKGVEFLSMVASNTSPGVSLVINSGSSPVFQLPNLTPGVTPSVDIAYLVRVNCGYTDTLSRNDLLSVLDTWQFRYDMGAQTGIIENDETNEYRDQIKVPFFTVSVSNNAPPGARVTQSYQRRIVVNNSGLDGWIREFVYKNTQGPGISVDSMTVNGKPIVFSKVPAFNLAGDTVINFIVPDSLFKYNTLGLLGPADGDSLFEPNETVTIIEYITLQNCDKSRLSTHEVSWGCDARFCNVLSRQDIITLGQGSVNVTFNNSGSVANDVGGYCKNGRQVVQFTNSGVEVDPGTATMFDIKAGVGMGQADSLKMSDTGYRITGVNISGVSIPLPAYGLVTINNNPLFAADPDGIGGLSDVDNDGFFDDLPVGQSLEIIVDYEVDCAANINTTEARTNDFESPFNARLEYMDICQKRDSFIQDRFFVPSNSNDHVENCTDPDAVTDGTPFKIEHMETRNVFNFERSCNDQEEMIVKIKLPTGITPIADSMKLFWFEVPMPFKSMSISNDTATVKFDATAALYLGGDYSLAMGFRANCTAIPGASEFPVEMAFNCPPCGCTHVWYYDTIQGPRIHYAPTCPPNPLYNCAIGLKTTNFGANRTTIGYTDTTYTTRFNRDSANLKVALPCDSISMVVKNVVGNTPISDSIGIVISYENIVSNDSNRLKDIFLFDTARVEIVKGGTTYTCFVGKTHASRQVIDDTIKRIRIDLHNCLVGLGIAPLSSGDSVNFYGMFTVATDGPTKFTFEKVPNFRAWGYYTENGVQNACDDWGETFRIGRSQGIFSYPSSSSFPIGCSETNLDYKVVMVNNDYRKHFGDEYRQAVGVDSIRFNFDPNFIKAFATSVEVSIPNHPQHGDNFFPLANLDSTGIYRARFDTLTKVPSLSATTGYAFHLRIKAQANCATYSGSSNGNNRFDFKPTIHFRDRYYATVIGDGSCSIYKTDTARYDNQTIVYNDPPQLKFEPVSNPSQNIVNDTVQWTMKLCNTSDKGKANHSWLSIEPVSPSVRNFKVISIKDITNNTSILTYPIKYFSPDSTKAFTFMNGLSEVSPSNTIDDVCNIVTITATVRECGMTGFDFKTGWLCTLPTDPTWNPTKYAPCVDSTLRGTVFIESPFLDANFINQSLDSTEVCDTTTLEILVRNTDLGTLFDMRSRITLPVQGASFVPNSFEFAYPSSAPYQAISSNPRDLGITQRGHVFEFDSLNFFSTYLNEKGIRGFNPSSPNDSNEIKIKFKFITDCDFRSGSLVYFTFNGFSACGTPSNNETGETLPLSIKGASLDTLKEFSVSSSATNVFVPGGESVVEVSFVNRNNNPSGPNDEISIKLPAGVRYKPGSTLAVVPSNWIVGEPMIRFNGNIQTLTWFQPQGLSFGDEGALQFIVRTADTLTCAGTLDIGLATYFVKDVICKSTGAVCKTEIITTSGGREQFFTVPLGRRTINFLSSLTITDNTLTAFVGDTVVVMATGAQVYRWYDRDSNRLIHSDSLLRYVPTRDSVRLTVKSGLTLGCVDSANLTIYLIADTIKPIITVRDTTINCQDNFPMLIPTVTDAQSGVDSLWFDDVILSNPCGDVLKRTWSARDSVGNIATAVQTITKRDISSPYFTSVPPNMIIRYFDIAPNDNPTAADSCSSVGITFIGIDTTVLPNGDTIFTKKWEAIDGCGNKSEATQIIIKTAPREVIRRDTILVGDSTRFCLNNLNIVGNINAIDPCRTGANIHVNYTLNAAQCIVSRGLSTGIDSTCYRICTDSSECTILKIYTVVRFPSTKDSISRDVREGKNDTICLNTSRLMPGRLTLTNICPDNANQAVEFEVYRESCIIIKAFEEGTKKGCFVLCDSTGKCDTTIITVRVTPSVIERRDSVLIGDSVSYCLKDLIPLKGNIVSVVNECPTTSDRAAMFVLDNNNCLKIKGLRLGTDTACFKVCTDSADCVTIRVIVKVKQDTTKDERNITITVGDSAVYCTTGVLRGQVISINNDCPATSNIAATYSYDANNCLIIKGLKVGFDTACLTLCTDSGTCIKIKVNVTVVARPKDTVRVNLNVGEKDTVCISRKSQLNGGKLILTNVCPDTTNKTTTWTILNDTCIIFTGNRIGKVTTCWQICDTTKKCDTIPIIVTVTGTKRLPIAVMDTAKTILNTPVRIFPLTNDTINGTLAGMTILNIPTKGTAGVVKDSTGKWYIVYAPNQDYCSNEDKDEILYEVCNENGCDTALIYVTTECSKLRIYNAFSPNNDGKNDVFYIEGLANYKDTRVIIYNRWGNLVYESLDYKNDWDGTWNGFKLPDGTYFYHIILSTGEKFTGYLQIHH